MEAQQSTEIADLGERVARIESKMDFVATREDIALVRREVEGTRTEIANTNTRIANMQAELLHVMARMESKMVTEIAAVNTLVATRETSMHRWLLGITATALVGVTTALIPHLRLVSHPARPNRKARPGAHQSQARTPLRRIPPESSRPTLEPENPNTGREFRVAKLQRTAGARLHTQVARSEAKSKLNRAGTQEVDKRLTGNRGGIRESC